jgi:hypothetical protein
MDGAGNGRKPFHGFILVFYERHETSNHERAFPSGHPPLYVLYYIYINIYCTFKKGKFSKTHPPPENLRRQDGAQYREFAANVHLVLLKGRITNAFPSIKVYETAFQNSVSSLAVSL